ncbi:hypothetical protein SAY87_029160 [Trapa incisa]|uniref:Protein kinase domain-containing protein n=1 Tax=Trapa incisa TaxID=236973 RepID=A0AAN7L3S9_9MYRT|nr:hypothetical protein SAY87_029160 [Trapa incisa]
MQMMLRLVVVFAVCSALDAEGSAAPATQRSASPPSAPSSIPPLSPPHEKPSTAVSPFTSRHHRHRSKLVSPAASLYLVSSPSSAWQAPSISSVPTPASMWRYNAPSPLDPGSLILPPPSMNPSPFLNVSTTPSPSPTEDCSGNVCTEPYTNTPHGSPCGCVWPIKVGLRLTVDLYTFFPMVSEFAAEVAFGVFMKQSQVRIIGANAAAQQLGKTVVLIDLVPMDEKFDHATALLTGQRFWSKQVAINSSYFGDYQVLYIHYPGLPPSPPLPPADVNIIDDRPFTGNDNNARTNKPLGVDLPRRQHKHGLSDGLVAIIVLSAMVAVVLCTAVCWILLKHRSHGSQQVPIPQALIPSVVKSSGLGESTLGSGPSSASLSSGSNITTFTGSARTFTASDIEKATDNFDPSRVLGEGGFGRVYSGTLDDGVGVAVKILKRDDQQGNMSFLI